MMNITLWLLSSKCRIIVIYENITKGQEDHYTTGWLLDYPYFKDSYKMIAVNLSKQQALDADPRANQKINFRANLDRAGNTRIHS